MEDCGKRVLELRTTSKNISNCASYHTAIFIGELGAMVEIQDGLSKTQLGER